MKALGLVVLGTWGLAPGARLAGLIKRTAIHCYKQNMKSSGPCGFGKEDFFFYVLPMTPPPPPSPGWGLYGPHGQDLAGFIMRMTIHCYTQNMKALGLVVTEKKIFKVFPMTPSGRGLYGPQGHGWQDL